MTNLNNMLRALGPINAKIGPRRIEMVFFSIYYMWMSIIYICIYKQHQIVLISEFWEKYSFQEMTTPMPQYDKFWHYCVKFERTSPMLIE